MAHHTSVNNHKEPSYVQTPDQIRLTDTQCNIQQVRVTAVYANGNRLDLSIDGSEKGLFRRDLTGIGSASIARDQQGNITLTVDRDKKFDGHIELSTPKGQKYLLSGELSMPKMTEVKTLEKPQELVAQEFHLKVEVDGISARPISGRSSSELFKMVKKASELGAEIVVVPGEKEKFAYQIRRGSQIAAHIEIPSGSNDFHSRRDTALREELSKLLSEPKASIEYKGRRIEFSRLQSPELYSQSKKLEESGMQIIIKADGADQCKIHLRDISSGYESHRNIIMNNDEVKAFARGQTFLPEPLKNLVSSYSQSSDLLLSNDGKTSENFNSQVANLNRKMPKALMDMLLNDNWKISTREFIPSSGRYDTSDLNERTPVGRCSFDRKEIEIAEYSMRGERKLNDPVHALYHEVGHVFFEQLSDEKKMQLEMALERDKAQLGDVSRYNDPSDSELSLKLSYYGNIREGVPECIEGIIDGNSNGARVMPKFYKNLYAATKRILEERGVSI